MGRALVVYDTKFGNTERIAGALAAGMREGGVDVDCVKTEEVDVQRLSGYDFLAVGGPTHKFGLSDPVKVFIEKLGGADLKGKGVFAFDTRYGSFIAGSAAKRIEKALKNLGANIVRPRSSGIIVGKEGKLEGGAEEEFKKIGVEIASLVEKNKT